MNTETTSWRGVSALALVAMASCATVQRPAPAAPFAGVSYLVKPIPAADRVGFEVDVAVAMDGADSVIVTLPTDYYGNPRLHRFVTRFEGRNGTVVSAAASDSQRVVRAGPDGIAHLAYAISYDPVEMADAAFGPNTGPRHFHVAGCQLLLQIGEDRNRRMRHRIGVAPPTGWHMYSSLSADPLVVDTVVNFRELISPAFGGSVAPPTRITVEGRPVELWVTSDLAVSRAQLIPGIERIVTLQREWFDDHSQRFYHIVVLPRNDVLAGTSIPNLFVTFVRPTATLEQILVLVAHEMFHVWVPNRLAIVAPEDERPPQVEWFHEGFPDFFGRVLLLEAGLLAPERFVALVNEDLRELATNPFRDFTYADLAAAASAGRYTGVHRQLSYNRGALLALSWQHAMRRSGSSLQKLLRELLAAADSADGKLTRTTFDAIGRRHGVQPLADLERYILQGAEIPVSAVAIDGGYALADTTVTVWRPGFDLAAAVKTGFISGVREGSPAYAAGLRNGQSYVRLQSWSRFSGRNVTVLVRDGGVERRLTFAPERASVTVPRFVPRP